jgi:hypothetical protein
MTFEEIERLRLPQIQNGLEINADDINAEFDQLVDQSNEHYTEIVGVKAKANSLANYLGDLTASGGAISSSPVGLTLPLADGFEVTFRLTTQVATGTALSLNLGGAGAWNILAQSGQIMRGEDIKANEVLKLVKRGTNWHEMNSGRGLFPEGYINMPAPTYSTARRVAINGTASLASADGSLNIRIFGNKLLDLDVVGLGGRAHAVSLSPNTWYYAYAVSLADGTSQDYAWSTSDSQSTLTIGGVSYKARQIPLAVRTDASSNILPFYMVSWEGRSSHTRYSTQLNGTNAGLAGSPTLIGLVSSGTYSAFSLASFVPPPSRVGTLFVYSRGGGGVLFRTTGDTNEYIYDLAGAVQSRELTILTDSSQSIDARVTVNGVDLAVTGYTINL